MPADGTLFRPHNGRRFRHLPGRADFDKATLVIGTRKGRCVGCWPVAGATVACRGGRLLGSTRRRVDPADCRCPRPSLMSAIEASSAAPFAKLDDAV
jgi:hypothetical protein